jgi:hypothetical protein
MSEPPPCRKCGAPRLEGRVTCHCCGSYLAASLIEWSGGLREESRRLHESAKKAIERSKELELKLAAEVPLEEGALSPDSEPLPETEED